jgi:para-nitrobenzyl esterase
VRGNLNMMALFQPSVPPTYGGPVIDGQVAVGAPDEIIAAGRAANVPLMIGTTGADIGFAFAQTKGQLFATFGSQAEAARRIYDPDGNADMRQLVMAVGADRGMHEPARHVASLLTARGAPAWLYRFSYVAESMRREWAGGAPHATDIPYFFDTVRAKYGDALTPTDQAAATAAISYVANFTRSGDPNGPGLPRWERFDPARANLLDFTNDRGPVPGPDPWRPRLDLVAQAAPPVPAR